MDNSVITESVLKAKKGDVKIKSDHNNKVGFIAPGELIVDEKTLNEHLAEKDKLIKDLQSLNDKLEKDKGDLIAMIKKLHEEKHETNQEVARIRSALEKALADWNTRGF